MSRIKNYGLYLDGTEPFEQLQFGAAGVKGVNLTGLQCHHNANNFFF